MAPCHPQATPNLYCCYAEGRGSTLSLNRSGPRSIVAAPVTYFVFTTFASLRSLLEQKRVAV